MRHLALTFPKAAGENHLQRSLGCANGARLCYSIFKTMTGSWQLTIWLMDEPRSEERTHQFTSAKKAKDYARADFRRRQIVRLAA